MNINKNTARTVTVLTVLVIGLLFSGSVVGALSLFGSKLTREDSQGAVRVSATFLPPETQQKGDLNTSFQLILDTHTVDLDQYDLEAISVFQFDNNKPVAGGKWSFTGSGHHFKGILTFPSTIPADADVMRLSILGIDHIEKRVFEWQTSELARR